MVNRKNPPPFRSVTNLNLPKAVEYRLDNGIPVHEVRMGTQEILKLEIIFSAGRWCEKKPIVSRMTASMLREGTQFKTAQQIAEKIDFYGGTLRFPVDLDTSHIVLYSLTKHFENLLPELQEILVTPAFPEPEVFSFVDRQTERLKMDLQKNEVLAYRQVTEMIFGSTHPYGYNSTQQLYENVSRADLVEHFNDNYTADNCRIIISGKTSPKIIQLLNQYLGKNIAKGNSTNKVYQRAPFEQKKFHKEKPNALQSAIRIGRHLFDRHHPDFLGMYVLNTVLGGYFGSRLMQNIREEKGYTYGIYSSIEPMLHDGFFYVSTEVGKDVMRPTLQEIYLEFKRLREELIPKEELEMVRNYLMGGLLSALDGAFSIAEFNKTLIVNNLNDDFFNKLVNTVRFVTPEELQRLAIKYLQPEDFYEVIVG